MHNWQNLPKFSKVHDEPTTARKRSTADTARKLVHSLAREAMAQKSFIPDEEVNVSELSSELVVFSGATSVVLRGRYWDPYVKYTARSQFSRATAASEIATAHTLAYREATETNE